MTRLEENLVSTDWLAGELGAPDLRILDCTVFLHPPDKGGTGFRIESGRDRWAEEHIPGAVFADLPHDLSDPNSSLRFMAPPPEQFAAAMARYGVGEGTRAVCYDRGGNMWAARIWWMLRAYGFEDAAVLDGGLRKWKLEGRPVTAETTEYPPARFEPRFDARRFATKDEVLASIGDGGTCILNALAPEQHRGDGPSPYGRPGRIAGSTNVAALAAVDSETGAYRPLADLRREFKAAGALNAQRALTYCGGGIAASSAALLLTLLGHDDVAVYDGSLSEWAADPKLPMEVG